MQQVSAGITAGAAAISAHQDLVQGHKYSYVIYKIGADEVEVETSKEADKSAKDDYDGYKEKVFNDFYAKMTSYEEPRFATLDFKFQTADGRKCDKVIFVWWYVCVSCVCRRFSCSPCPPFLVLLCVCVCVHTTIDLRLVVHVYVLCVSTVCRAPLGTLPVLLCVYV